MDFEAAEAAYEAIRNSSTDVSHIAATTGCKRANIAKVKTHLFYAIHLLDRYEHLGIPADRRKFDADMRIAEAWGRLESGRGTPADIRLLKHEIAEAWYMRGHGPSYAQAHAAAQRRYPSPFEGPER
jgi:hypothetical protein